MTEGESPLEKSHEKVRVDGSLMGLVDDDTGTSREKLVSHDLSQENPLRHVRQTCPGVANLLKTDVIANLIAEFHIHLLGDTGSHAFGGQYPRLRTDNLQTASKLVKEDKLRYLRRLS